MHPATLEGPLQAGGDDDVEAALEQRPLAGETAHEGLVIEGKPAQHLVAAATRTFTQAVQVSLYVCGQDAHNDLEGVGQGVQERLVAGDDPFLLGLGLEGEVDALGVEDRPVIAAAQTEDALDDVLHG
ncbi:MAG: hypothetical protein GEU75_10810 [Dehalococcoidia bacterium]|nr:hypothetical protein [Dehalococcoidia bacterium]